MKYVPALLAVLTTLGFFGLIALFMFHPAPESSVQVLNIMTGSLAAAYGGIIGYFFGSSAGSAAKTEIMSKAVTPPKE